MWRLESNVAPSSILRRMQGIVQFRNITRHSTEHSGMTLSRPGLLLNLSFCGSSKVIIKSNMRNSLTCNWFFDHALLCLLRTLRSQDSLHSACTKWKEHTAILLHEGTALYILGILLFRNFHNPLLFNDLLMISNYLLTVNMNIKTCTYST